MAERSLFTSESVSMGHPDKMADQVSDAILDAILEQDPSARVACETFLTTGLCMVAGEITTTATIDVDSIARQTIREIGYTDASYGYDANTCAVMSSLHTQSPDIAMGVNADAAGELGAGDQGLMFGYACTDTPELMPLPIALSHKLVARLAELRENGTLPWLRPDSKSQVTVEYDGRRPVRVHTIVISTQHAPEVDQPTIKKAIREFVIEPVVPAELWDSETVVHVNPTGRFVYGGPGADTGLTGRKIIVDTYGGRAPHGGGAFSGKDATKVDRSASYMARYIAKNIVAAGLAEEASVQLAYAIGVAEPVSVLVDTNGSGVINDRTLETLVREHFQLTPKGIIDHLNLRRPIYRHTAYHGHFGRDLETFTWERTDVASTLRQAAGLEKQLDMVGAAQ